MALIESLSRDLDTDHVIRFPSLDMFASPPLLNLLLQIHNSGFQISDTCASIKLFLKQYASTKAF